MRRLVLGSLISMLVACGGNTDDAASAANYSVRGHVQKGPFVNGSSLTVSELSAKLSPTGKVFASELLDDSGAFDVGDATLAHPIARLTADGFYFDENRGELSSARLELHALVDVASAAQANVNVLGHLERARIEHLVRDVQLDFSTARQQARGEVLAIFGMTDSGVGDFDQLDVSQGGAGDAKLLAASVLVQGYRTVGEMAELLSAIATDIRTDGTLDSASSGSALMNAAVLVDLAKVREHLEARYATLGLPATIGDFESHVIAFRDTAPWPADAAPSYPADVTHGDNLLAPDMTEYPIAEHSLTADLPEGMALRVVITGTAGGPWFYGDSGGWDVSTYDFALAQQEFVALEDGERAHMTLFFEGPGAATIDYYENGATTPTRSKAITWDCTANTCECGFEEMMCDGVCVGIKENPDHCGGCGIACEMGLTCVDMACVADG